MKITKERSADLLEIGMVIAMVFLVIVIYVPIAIWEEEKSFEIESRFRMGNLYDVEVFYEQLIGNYNSVATDNKNYFSIPLNIYKNGLYMRRWHAGDRMLSATSNKNILISDLFINNKLSIIGKLLHPIIVDKMDHILWVPGMAHAKIKRNTKNQKIKVIEWVQA